MADLRIVSPVGPGRDDNGQQGEALTPAETRFVDAIASGGSLSDGATAAGISYRSAKRWHRKAHIQAAIKARVSESLSQARAVLASGSARAARGLVDMADGTAEAHAARVAAARAVIESAAKLSEQTDLEERIAELERLNTAGAPGFSKGQ